MDDIVTNLGKYKSEVIYELVKSLNSGGKSELLESCGSVEIAKKQYREMVRDGIIVERDKDWNKKM